MSIILKTTSSIQDGDKESLQEKEMTYVYSIEMLLTCPPGESVSLNKKKTEIISELVTTPA